MKPLLLLIVAILVAAKLLDSSPDEFYNGKSVSQEGRALAVSRPEPLLGASLVKTCEEAAAGLLVCTGQNLLRRSSQDRHRAQLRSVDVMDRRGE